MSRIKYPEITPLSDNVAILPDELHKITASGLEIPETADRKPVRGIVIAVGQGRMTIEGTRVRMNVSKGDIVTFPRHAGTAQEHNEQKFLLMRETELLAIVGNTEEEITIEIVQGEQHLWYDKEIGSKYPTFDDGSDCWEIEYNGSKHFVPKVKTKIVSKSMWKDTTKPDGLPSMDNNNHNPKESTIVAEDVTSKY